MKFLILTTLLVLVACSHADKKSSPVAELRVTENNPNKLTALTKQNVFQLVQIYDLEPYLFTKDITIQTGVIPHSHPILTLNTRYADQPMKILASLLHEEFHWWVGLNQNDYKKAVTELSKMFPNKDRNSYQHLIICYLEYKALVKFLGKKEATKLVRSFMNRDKIYPWVYTQIITHETKIASLVKRNKLLAQGL